MRREPARVMTLLLPALAVWLAACASEQPSTGPEASDGDTPVVPSFALASNTWAARSPLPSGACGVAAGLAVDPAGKSTVYVIGGNVCGEGGLFGGVYAYDVPSDTWTRKGADYPVASPNGLGKIGNKFYVAGGVTFSVGGESGRFKTMAYDFTNDRFLQKADMPKAGGEGVSGVIKDKLYVLSGFCDGDRFPDPRSCDVEPNHQLYRYDPVTNTWATLAPAPHVHRFGVGGVINHKLYVVGGREECCQKDVADLDVYDPATNTWKTLAPIPSAGPAIGAMLRNRLYVIRGPGAGNLYVYDPATNIWKTKRGPVWSHAAATRVMIGGIAYLLAVGGSHGPNIDIPNPSELYTP